MYYYYYYYVLCLPPRSRVIKYIVTFDRKRKKEEEEKKYTFFGIYNYTGRQESTVSLNMNVFLFFKSVLQDRLTFRRIIVKNNAKKRKLYEAFIETLPLLTSLEVNISFVLQR